jgi:hypothetical protein
LYDDLAVTALGESTTSAIEGFAAFATPVPCQEAKEWTKSDGTALKVTLEEGGT